MPDDSNPRKRSRSRSRSRSPPRQRKRPGGAARIDAAAKARIEERQRQRENEAQAAVAARGAHDAVRQHYNAVPQRGREWRRNDSKIKNLRSYNNWAKSVLIQKFSPSEEYRKRDFSRNIDPLKVLDIGCGKGGDLGKWQKAPQRVALYVGVDPAEVSIDQARERYSETARRARGRVFDGKFFARDGYGEWIGTLPLVSEVGVDSSVTLEGAGSSRWGGGGFDVVTMMFCMHYSFETEAKARGMLRNVASALKRGGRFIGAIPDSDALRKGVEAWYIQRGKGEKAADEDEEESKNDSSAASAASASASKTEAANGAAHGSEDAEKGTNEAARHSTPPKGKEADPSEANANDSPSSKDQHNAKSAQLTKDEEDDEECVEWGNSLFRVRFPNGPGAPPPSGIFRPPFGWRYQFFLTEAVESVPEYVVPFEAFRALAEEFGLELQYRKPFREIWDEEGHSDDLGQLAARMGVPAGPRGGGWGLDGEEAEAVGFYLGFCFYKV